MKAVKSVLFATDFTPASREASKTVIKTASANNAEVPSHLFR
jgi:hypothetical protein